MDSITGSTKKVQVLRGESSPIDPIPIVETARETSSQEQQEAQAGEQRLNKYIYDEFSGYAGERYLDTICQKILPYALWRTWRYAVEYQAPGLPCYVGTARLAERVKPQQRKIEMDLQEFRERGLVHMYADRLPILQADGTVKYCAVTVKDWTPLYDLAHEYHIWTLSPHYVPAEREYVDLLVAEPELLQKLIRFDNYRRAIMNKKPGRKPQQAAAYQCSLPGSSSGLASHAAAPDNTNVLNPKYYINASVNTSSPYRRSSTVHFVTDENTNSNSQEKEGVLTPTTIRSIHQGPTPNLERRTEPVERELSKSNSSNLQQEEEGAAPPAPEVEAVEDCNIEKLKQNPLALAATLAEMVTGQKHQQAAYNPHRQRKPVEPPRTRRVVPDWFINRVAQEAQALKDDPKSLQSVITRLSKTYLTAQQVFSAVSQREVLNRFDTARKATEDHARRITKRGTNGSRLYMPYFIQCFISSWGFHEDELAFIESDEPLYEDGYIGDFVERLTQRYKHSGSKLEYMEWVQQYREQQQKKRRGKGKGQRQE